MKLSLILKPSLIGQYFEKQCTRYLVYYALDEQQYKDLGWTKPTQNESATSLAGMKWEQIIIDGLKRDKTCELINLGQSDGKKSIYDDTVSVLKNLSEQKKTIYLYQACFTITPSFIKDYLPEFDENKSNVTFSERMYPDFIKAEYSKTKKKYCLTIIDAKNANKIKVGAEIQVALYTRILKAIIKDEGISNCYVNEEEGIVWNREKITDKKLEHTFILNDAYNLLDKFFSDNLVDICNRIDVCENGSTIQENLTYRLSTKCEYCTNFDNCINKCKTNKSVRLMPYITIDAQNRLDELTTSGDLKDETIDSLKDLLNTNPDLLTSDCWYWKTVSNNQSIYENVLNSFLAGKKEKFVKESSTFSFPKYQDYELILTAQVDANAGRPFAYAWLLKPNKGLDIYSQGLGSYGFVEIYEGKNDSKGKGTYFNSIIAQNDSKKEFDRIDREFVESIYDLLKRISESEDTDRRRLQCYVMDNYELINIENALYNILENNDSEKDQEYFEKIMAILFWIQGERLVTDADILPEEVIENPVTVLSREISRLYVLSDCVAYGLRTVASIFSPKYNFDNSAKGYLGELSNVMDSISAVKAWEEKDKEKKKNSLEWICAHLRKRLFVESNIIASIQMDDDVKNKLVAKASQYKMQNAIYENNPEIARLDFENRYEQLLTYRQVRQSRIYGVQHAIDNGTILSIEYTGQGNTYKILNADNYIGREWFCTWLCEDNEENRQQIQMQRDLEYTAHPRVRSAPKYELRDSDTVFYPADFANKFNFVDNGTSDVTVDFMPKKDADFNPIAGNHYLLFEVYSDLNASKTSSGISILSDRPKLLNPKELSSPTEIVYDKEIEDICSKYWSLDGHQFSDSQKAGFIHLLEQKLTVLVGPPAAGKTDFIARALITIACYYKEKHNKSLKIMVSAMSHSAIENVLLKIAKMLESNNPYNIRVCKAGKLDDPQALAGKHIGKFDNKSDNKSVAYNISNDDIQIVGMTCWSAYTEFHAKDTLPAFDMIVLDEGSQVRAMDAFLTLECSNDDTRFLLVGDDDQLPPIIGGKYKSVDNQKYIHGSIFRLFVSGLGKGHPDIVTLYDNFRMNGILCKYSAKAIYGPKYQAFNTEIREQRISLNNKNRDCFIDNLLDPDYPLVFCELSGTARGQHEAEVQLVTDIVHELWDSQLNTETNNLASDDGNFWKEALVNGKNIDGACGIISPHHEHINRLKTSIAKDLGLETSDIFIGTVDKLQGKERKTVIVSYGVYDQDRIQNEKEFIFSKNRFNVSLTRGKAKTIVFLSESIAESNMETNVMGVNDEALGKGIDFIHGFADFMKKQEKDEEMMEGEYEYGDIVIKVWKKKLK